jgi:hypothetical protein
MQFFDLQHVLLFIGALHANGKLSERILIFLIVFLNHQL